MSPGAAALRFALAAEDFFCRKKLPCRELEKRNLIELANMERRDPEKRGVLVHSLMPQFRRRVLQQQCMRARTQIPIPTARTHSGADFVNYVIEIKRLRAQSASQLSLY
jgi:hypothetical protein